MNFLGSIIIWFLHFISKWSSVFRRRIKFSDDIILRLFHIDSDCRNTVVCVISFSLCMKFFVVVLHIDIELFLFVSLSSCTTISCIFGVQIKYDNRYLYFVICIILRTHFRFDIVVKFIMRLRKSIVCRLLILHECIVERFALVWLLTRIARLCQRRWFLIHFI